MLSFVAFMRQNRILPFFFTATTIIMSCSALLKNAIVRCGGRCHGEKTNTMLSLRRSRHLHQSFRTVLMASRLNQQQQQSRKRQQQDCSRCPRLSRNSRGNAFFTTLLSSPSSSPEDEIRTRQNYSFSDSSSKNNNNGRIRLEIPTAEDMEDFGAILASQLLLMTTGDDEDGDDDDRLEGATSGTATKSAAAVAGSVICLYGNLGSGKTVLARGFVRACTGDWDLRVTSPTYLLDNTYYSHSRPRRGGSRNKDDEYSDALEIHHMDLYRLDTAEQHVKPLNLQHVFSNCVSIIEWPDRLGPQIMPEQRLDIHMGILQSQKPMEEAVETSAEEEEAEVTVPRWMTLEPHGFEWEGRIQNLLDEGYVEDLLLPMDELDDERAQD